MSSLLNHSGNTPPSPSNFIPEGAFLTKLHEAVQASIQTQSTGALFFICVTNLSMILSSYGDALGDETMERLTEELKVLVGQEGSVARILKDTVAVMLVNIPKDTIAAKSERFHNFVQQFGCNYASVPIHLCEFMGSVDFPISANTPQTVIEKAYIALNIARKEGMHYHFTYADMGKRQMQAKHQMILASYMQHAIRDGRLRLAFQPIINSKNGHIIYHESLLRIIGEDGKISSAGPFIPIAEAMGFIDVVDDKVLAMVVNELRLSQEIILAFNISNLTVTNEKWLQKAKKLFSDPDIGGRVVIEMTETAMHGDMRQVSYFIAALQDLGCQVAIDDFGVGYTSFRQLKALPIDIVKIDGYFVKDIVENSENLLFVKTLLDFTRGLGLKAVAEFVETGEIAKLLMELKVDYMQGNYFCPAVNYRSWMKGEKEA